MVKITLTHKSRTEVIKYNTEKLSEAVENFTTDFETHILSLIETGINNETDINIYKCGLHGLNKMGVTKKNIGLIFRATTHQLKDKEGIFEPKGIINDVCQLVETTISESLGTINTSDQDQEYLSNIKIGLSDFIQSMTQLGIEESGENLIARIRAISGQRWINSYGSFQNIIKVTPQIKNDTFIHSQVNSNEFNLSFPNIITGKQEKRYRLSKIPGKYSLHRKKHNNSVDRDSACIYFKKYDYEKILAISEVYSSGKGKGKYLIQEIIKDFSEDYTVALFSSNGAKKVYENLGFKKSGNYGIYYYGKNIKQNKKDFIKTLFIKKV